MKLVVGAPVKDRAWILPQWFEHTLAAVEHSLHVSEVEFVLVGRPEDESQAAAAGVAKAHGIKFSWVDSSADDPDPYARNWSLARYEVMATVRNQLLEEVRSIAPDLFWSLDTDILVAEPTLTSALHNINNFDALGTKLYMTPKGRFAPSYAMLAPRGGMHRDDASGVFAVDMIMASKLMRPKAYAVDYVAHRQGEDAGWSIAARRAGCKLGWDGTTTSKHVMSPEMLAPCDSRCGF